MSTIAGLSTAGGASASSDPSQICEQAAIQASRDSGVPLDVMRAITLTETGRRQAGGFRPWPWTVNMQGQGVWFDTPHEALAYVEANYGTGARSFDVGCFQINYKWHGRAFASIAQMFDPAVNARYAANLLRSLHGELGSWSAAAGAYHSRTPEFAARYRDRFDRIRARLGGQPPAPAEADGQFAGEAAQGAETSLPAADGMIPEIPDVVLAMNGGADAAAPAPLRVNRYPLLQQSGPFAPVMGSLVPPSSGPVTALFGPDPAPVAGGISIAGTGSAVLTDAVSEARADDRPADAGGNPGGGAGSDPTRLD